MTSIRNRNGKWQARITRKGEQPVAKTFQSKQDAERWARQIESDIDKGSYTNLLLADKSLFKDLIERYIKDVTLNSRSADVFCTKESTENMADQKGLFS